MTRLRRAGATAAVAGRMLCFGLLAGGAVIACGSSGGAPASTSPGSGGAGNVGAEPGLGGAGGSAGAGGVVACAGATGGAGGTGGGNADALAACAACELASTADSCEADFLTATRDATGNPTGWGIATLETQAERDTGAALLHCVNVNQCAANADNSGPGSNTELGCFCGAGISVGDCLSGAGIHGPCIAEYEAAAAATPTGPAACSSLAAFAGFIATVTSNWKSPIGIANNVNRCAIDTPCPVCDTL
jgi:hypothetical protein